ncbi:MAG: hypothetical protein GY737_05705 [Desulfobacteraceae bacterium]|nr:hypothetical protein [Desulfobacteraceae bacterium]
MTSLSIKSLREKEKVDKKGKEFNRKKRTIGKEQEIESFRLHEEGKRRKEAVKL